MRLSAQTAGHGPDLVLLHGWGMHSGVWQPILEQLTTSWRVTMIDLPGHGNSHAVELDVWDDRVLDALVDVGPEQAIWLGWSISGMLALQLALRHAQRVSHLILLACNASFVTRTDWPCAIEPAVLQQFNQDLHDDYARTLQRFLALQVKGSAYAQSVLRQLREQFTQTNAPSSQTLEAGLAYLQQSDLRTSLTRLQQPVSWLGGTHDTLVPAVSAQAMQTLQPALQISTIDGAGHAPFLSHSRQFLSELEACLHD